MYTLETHLRYTVAVAERLSKWRKSKVEDDVKQLFREMKVPNLGILGKIELKERSIIVECHAKRRSTLYQDFSTLKEALAEQRFAEIWEKKGIISIQLKEKNEGQSAGNHPTKWLYSAVAQDSPVKLEPESLSVPAVATYASAAPGTRPRPFAPALASSLSESSLPSSGHSFTRLDPLPPSSHLQQGSSHINAVEDAVDCSSPHLPSYPSTAGVIPMLSAPMSSRTWYDYDAPPTTTSSSPPSTSTAPMTRQPVPPLPTRRRYCPAATAATVIPKPPPSIPEPSPPHTPAQNLDAMVCGESNAVENGNSIMNEGFVTSPPYIPSSPPYIPSSPPYRPTTPRINVVESRKAIARPGGPADRLKASPPIMSNKRPSSSSSTLGKRRAEEAPSRSYGGDGDDDAMNCDEDAEPISASSEVAEQSAFVSSWLDPQPSTFGSHPPLPPPPSVSRQTSGSSSSSASTSGSSSSSSSSSSTMPPATVDVSRLTIKRPRRYANSSTEEEDFGESGKSFLESRKAKRTGAPARPTRITTTTGTATKPYDQAKRSPKPRRQDSAAQSDEDDDSGSSSDSSSSSSSSTSPRRSTPRSKSNNGSDSEATVVTTSAIQTMNPGLSDAELLTAWREAGGRLFESIQELVNVKKMIYHGIGERLIEERKRECGHCKNDFERDLRKLGRKLLRQEYKRLSRLL